MIWLLVQASENHSLNVTWVNDEHCKDITLECDGNILVFESFDSPGFLYWEKNASKSPFRVE